MKNEKGTLIFVENRAEIAEMVLNWFEMHEPKSCENLLTENDDWVINFEKILPLNRLISWLNFVYLYCPLRSCWSEKRTSLLVENLQYSASSDSKACRCCVSSLLWFRLSSRGSNERRRHFELTGSSFCYRTWWIHVWLWTTFKHQELLR